MIKSINDFYFQKIKLDKSIWGGFQYSAYAYLD